jgi:hypothetical protein
MADTTEDLSGAQGTSDPGVAEPWYRWLWSEAKARDSYGLLLALLVIDYLILSIGEIGPGALIASSVSVSVTAVLAFHTSLIKGRPFMVVRIAAAVAVLAAVGASVSANGRGKGVAFLILALLMMASPLAVAVRIVRHFRVTVHTLLGAICIYVLIGLDFAFGDLAVQLISGNQFFAQPGVHHSPDFLYFSFITMTSVGYGDLSPAYGFPRTMAVMEALTGQIFLVVMVSRLVALLTPSQRGARRAAGDDDPPEGNGHDGSAGPDGPSG